MSRSIALLFLVLATLGLDAQVAPVATPLYSLRESMDGFVFSAGGKDYGPYPLIRSRPFYSDSFSSWMVIAEDQAKGAIVIVNGKEFPIGKKVENQHPIQLSDDGSRWAIHLSLTPDQGDQRDCFMVDGKLLGPYLKTDFRTNPSGWYAFVERKDKPGQRLLLVGDRTFGPYEDLRGSAVDPATGQTVYQVTNKGQTIIIRNGKESPPVQRAEFVLTRTGAFIGVATWAKTGVTVQIADKSYGPYEDLDIFGAWMAKDGSSWAFSARKKEGMVLVRDGKESLYDWVDLNDRDGKLLVVAGKGGRGFLSDGGKEYGPYWNILERFVPATGPWVIGVEKRRADGSTANFIVTPGAEYPGFGLRFDGETYTWVSMDEDGKASLMSMPAKP